VSATRRRPWFRRRRHDRDDGTSATLPADPVDDERRQLTVMFVDLVGSTEMAEHHEPEVVRDVLRQYHQLCGAAASAHHGYIARYEGDGIMVYFGFPKAREDDARHAVLAGLELLERVTAAAADMRRERGIEFTARVGIHTGVVLVAEMGVPDSPAHDAVIGSAPNQAARLQSLAPPGGLVISDDT
jgi:class 3 adenylate cyclase